MELSIKISLYYDLYHSLFDKRNIQIIMQAGEQQRAAQKEYTNPQQITTVKIKNMLSICKLKPHPLEDLPESFRQFMIDRGLDINQLSIIIPRYVRAKPGNNITSQDIAKDIGIRSEEVVKVDHQFWALNPEVKINRSKMYQEGLIYGMDYSSAIPVRCLSLIQNCKVLQLCSAPGNKSMLMADSINDISIKGVEISANRANIMKSLIKKYNLLSKIQVLQEDGLLFKSEVQFDRVLVDAQCTHQGSLKHIFKFLKQMGQLPKKEKKLTKQQEKQLKANHSNPYTSSFKKANQWSKDDFQQRFLDQFKLANLEKLQRGLLQNGFSLLKAGGILVYSTCSFDEQQNEKIVADFLQKYENAQLLDASERLVCSVGWKEGKLKGTLRFSPSISLCGGMFISKIGKKCK